MSEQFCRIRGVSTNLITLAHSAHSKSSRIDHGTCTHVDVSYRLGLSLAHSLGIEPNSFGLTDRRITKSLRVQSRSRGRVRTCSHIVNSYAAHQLAFPGIGRTGPFDHSRGYSTLVVRLELLVGVEPPIRITSAAFSRRTTNSISSGGWSRTINIRFQRPAFYQLNYARSRSCIFRT